MDEFRPPALRRPRSRLYHHDFAAGAARWGDADFAPAPAGPVELGVEILEVGAGPWRARGEGEDVVRVALAGFALRLRRAPRGARGSCLERGSLLGETVGGSSALAGARAMLPVGLDLCFCIPAKIATSKLDR